MRIAVALAIALFMAACSASEPKDATPFTGTWHTDMTTMTVAKNGGLHFRSTTDCTGRVARVSPVYRFTMTCGSSTMAGDAKPPAKGAFTITWADGDSSRYTH
ncbi:hypothetical protein [Actinomadura rupiterrae]|uniref:hypothetical protein n=1 Tax=Actinomadura rupiterrae TaxID=559627 RepID=UPI0020A29777|nr:hypothetical protein [Actinomadura rupiterrae]MCP2338380.1 hypothetical protein [Actinomadura rupiterrae]